MLKCELTSTERDVYDAVRAATKKEVVKKLAAGAGTLAVLEALLRLRQAACHSGLLPGHEKELDQASSKLVLLRETLEEALEEGHKALVFSQWTSLLDLVGNDMTKHDIGFVRLDGTTKDRKAVVDAFQDDNGPKVMLVSLKAGGTGLNLTAADHVFMLDPWWNPAVEDQAADRAHRIGQTRPVIVHRLVAEDTVEERIVELQLKKRELAEAAIGKGGAAAQEITKKELLALLE
jgi:SNF2 family DNA or RNA helicase